MHADGLIAVIDQVKVASRLAHLADQERAIYRIQVSTAPIRIVLSIGS